VSLSVLELRLYLYTFYKQELLLTWLLVFLLPSQFCAHGVKSFVGSGGIVVTSQYDTGEPMSHLDISPGVPAFLNHQSYLPLKTIPYI